MRNLFLFPILFFFLVPAVFAQPAKPGGSKALDPCTLVTKAEIQETTGVKVGDGVLNKTANAAVGAPCEFKVEPYGAVSFLAKLAGPGETADRMMAELKKQNIATTEAPGVGDRSFFAAMGYGMIQLNTFKGSNYIILTLMLPNAAEDKVKTAATTLMKKALTKL